MNLIKIITVGFLISLFWYLFMPIMALDNPNLYWFLSMLSCIFFIISGRFKKDRFGDIQYTWSNFSSASLVVFMVTILILIVGGFISWSWPNETKYYELIGDVNTRDFESHVAPIDQSKIIIIDEETAARLGEKTLVADAEKSVVGSQVVIGDYWLQQVNGNLYYVAPTLHRSYWKYRKNKEGTEGYIMVNAVNEKDVQYVDEHKIKYQPNAFFKDNLYRHLYLNGYSTTYLNQPEFEINEQGHPYWVFARYERTIGFSGKQVNGIVLVHATTGEIEEYDTNDAPLWVDRIQPVEFIEQQLGYWGDLVEGYWNWQDLNKKRITSGIVMTYGQDGRCYYYTGVTSVGKDGATIGFITVDSRTKQVTMYRIAGATEERGMSSAQGAVQEKGYVASFPRMYNINGIPTYVMALKDREGLIKLVAMVSVENYETVAIGETVKKTLRQYQSKLNSSFADLVINENEIRTITVGQVIRLRQEARSGLVYLWVQDVSKIITVDSDIYPEVMLTEPGDKVAIRLFESEDITASAEFFDNLILTFEVSNQQLQLEYELAEPTEYNADKQLIPETKEQREEKKSKKANNF